jgi:hypothetical protein
VHVRTLEPTVDEHYANSADGARYSFAPAAPKTGVEKAGYYVDLVHALSGDHLALWVDMDAPGSALDDVIMPVTSAQKKKTAVTKLHVWSNTRANIILCIQVTRTFI